MIHINRQAVTNQLWTGQANAVQEVTLAESCTKMKLEKYYTLRRRLNALDLFCWGVSHWAKHARKSVSTSRLQEEKRQEEKCGLVQL